MLEYDVAHRVKRLWVRGWLTVRFCTNLKAVGVNLFRAAAVRGPGVWPPRLLRAINAPSGVFSRLSKSIGQIFGADTKDLAPRYIPRLFPRENGRMTFCEVIKLWLLKNLG